MSDFSVGFGATGTRVDEVSDSDLEIAMRQARAADPAFAQWADQHPDSARVLIMANRYGWTDGQKEWALRKTSGYQPQGGGGGFRGGGGGGISKQQQIKNLAAELSDRAKQLGLSALTNTDIVKIAGEAVKNKWTEASIVDRLLVSVDWSNVTGGDLTAGADAVKKMGAEYMVSVGDTQARDWSLRLAKGELTQQGITSMMQAQSRARYSWMGNLIDQGIKPADYFAPIRNVIAQTLEVSPDTIDLLDPKWMDMVEVRDDKTGSTRAATLNEAMLSARKRPEWSATRQAQDAAASTVTRLAGMFGRAA